MTCIKENAEKKVNTNKKYICCYLIARIDIFLIKPKLIEPQHAELRLSVLMQLFVHSNKIPSDLFSVTPI